MLVLVGDDDLIELSYTCAMYEAIPEAQLAVVPGSSTPFRWRSLLTSAASSSSSSWKG